MVEKDLKSDEVNRARGASLVEYTLLMMLMVMATISMVSFFGETVSERFSVIEDHFETGTK